jgi:hypothetical protein
MATTVTATLPAGILLAHVRSSVRYHRFEPNRLTANLQDTVNDNNTFNGTSITFTVQNGLVTPWFPSGITQLHVSLTNGHYYRFENQGQGAALQNGDSSGSFTTISFTTA